MPIGCRGLDPSVDLRGLRNTYTSNLVGRLQLAGSIEELHTLGVVMCQQSKSEPGSVGYREEIVSL